jgi:hypothetical protein
MRNIEPWCVSRRLLVGPSHSGLVPLAALKTVPNDRRRGSYENGCRGTQRWVSVCRSVERARGARAEHGKSLWGQLVRAGRGGTWRAERIRACSSCHRARDAGRIHGRRPWAQRCRDEGAKDVGNPRATLDPLDITRRDLQLVAKPPACNDARHGLTARL